jgi:hypothetical protein
MMLSPELSSLFLQVAACPKGMLSAITEAAGILEGIGPGFTELRNYLKEIDSPEEPEDGPFSDRWNMSGEVGTPGKVVHFLTSGMPEAREAWKDIIDMGLGETITFVSATPEVRRESARLNRKEENFLRSVRNIDEITPDDALAVLNILPETVMAVCHPVTSNWSNSDERNLTFPDDPSSRQIVNGWLVHNSDRAMDIYRQGFRRGNSLGYLAFGRPSDSRDDRYGFAYLMDDAPAPGERNPSGGLKYTDEGSGKSIVFRGSGSVVDHASDMERQVIFDIAEPDSCFLVTRANAPKAEINGYNDSNWEVYGKNPERPLLKGKSYRECLAWIRDNGDAYAGQMRRWDRRPLGEAAEGQEAAEAYAETPERSNVTTVSMDESQIKALKASLDEAWERTHSYAMLDRLMKQTGVPYIAGGTARRVYQLNGERVLKVAKNAKGSAQNDTEADWALRQTGAVAYWHDVSEHDSIWIESELCVKARQADFRRILGISFADYCAFVNYTCQERNGRSRYFSYPEPANYLEMVEREDLVGYVYNYIGDFAPPPGDLTRISSYGINRDGELVLVDSGLSDRVFEQHYSRKRALHEGVLSGFGKKLARGMVAAALATGMMSNAYGAKTDMPKPKVSVQKEVKGNRTITTADMKNLYASKAYQERVAELVAGMLRDNPGADEQRTYTKACMQALDEVATGKLKP